MTSTPANNPSTEEQLKIAQEQLLRSQKMAALGELVSTTTHEFNNVLMTIINYAKMGMRHRDDATRDKAFDKIMAAGQRAAKITEVVLGVARNRSDDFEATDLGKLMEDTLVLLDREMSKYRVTVERVFESVPPARALGNQIQQVLLNLLTNARQAMPNGGTIVLKLTLDATQNMVVFSVRDNGSGIPNEKLRRIFDPYFSTKSGPDDSGKGGTGLGLSACRSIIEAHKGRIRVESTVGKGTAFTIMLPVYAPIVAPTPNSASVSTAIPTQ